MSEPVPEITTVEAATRLATDTVWVDVREPDEQAAGVIPSSHLVPLADLAGRIGDVVPDRDHEIILYCAVGQRSLYGAGVLRDLGYTRAMSLAGGFGAWKSAGHPWERPAQEDSEEIRYARHTRLAQVGVEGQAKLGSARVLVIGAGGLGSPAALYLAAAGVGTIGIVDFDDVELSNLQRQVIHTTDRIGTPKTRSAQRSISALNPHVEVVRHDLRLDAANVLGVLDGYDVVIDGTDNFPTRYLINDAALHLGVPVIHGSILRFEGQASTFVPYAGPCYRCLFPAPPPPELAPSCAEVGVLGVLPGVIGSIQALEAIKLVLGIGEPLVGRLLLYDALTQRFDEVRFGRDPACPACADPDSPPRLVDYDETCRPA